MTESVVGSICPDVRFHSTLGLPLYRGVWYHLCVDRFLKEWERHWLHGCLSLNAAMEILIAFILARKQGSSLSSSSQVSYRNAWKGALAPFVLSQEPTWPTVLPLPEKVALPKLLKTKMKRDGSRAFYPKENLQEDRGQKQWEYNWEGRRKPRKAWCGLVDALRVKKKRGGDCYNPSSAFHVTSKNQIFLLTVAITSYLPTVKGLVEGSSNLWRKVKRKGPNM